MKETFTVTKDGQELKLAVVKPTQEQTRKAQMHYNKSFAALLNSGTLVRSRLEQYVKGQGLWNDEKDAEESALIERIRKNELKLKKGGIKLQEAKDIAIDTRVARMELLALTSDIRSLDNKTAEGQAETERFNYLVSCCIVYEDTGKPYYSSLEEYIENSSDEVARKGANLLANMLYGFDPDYESKLPENVFLKKYNFVDSQLRLINKDGRLVNTEGKLVDENGRYIDSEGNLVDRDGNRVDEDGNYIVEHTPFLDDDGNPVPEPT